MDTHTIYLKVVKVAQAFVSQRAHLTIEALNDFDPSLEELAEVVRSISEMISALSSDFKDRNMAINAFQCSLDLERLARAALDGDQQEVDSALDALVKYCTGPY